MAAVLPLFALTDRMPAGTVFSHQQRTECVVV
jgi:hypothetical protein